MSVHVTYRCTGCSRVFATARGARQHRRYHDALKVQRRRAAGYGCPTAGRVRRDGAYGVVEVREVRTAGMGGAS